MIRVPTSRPHRLLPLSLAALLAACGPADRQDDSGDAPAGTAVPADTGDFDRQWFGVLPCADCDGIQTRLRLLREGDERHFELEERYLGGELVPSFSQQGTWQEGGEAGHRLYVLDPDGAGLRLLLLEDGSLELLDAEGAPQGPAYRLGRI